MAPGLLSINDVKNFNGIVNTKVKCVINHREISSVIL